MERSMLDLRDLSKVKEPKKVRVSRDDSDEAGTIVEVPKPTPAAETMKPEQPKESQEAKDEDKTPIQLSVEYLKENNITKEMLLEIQTNLIEGKDLKYEVDICGGIPVVFTQRPEFVTSRLYTDFSAMGPVSMPHYSQRIGVYNLAGSIVSYASKPWPTLSKETFQKRLDMVEMLPTNIVHALVEELRIFDTILMVVSTDEALDAFMQPLSENS